jgi:NAD(P)-dependent dehydrogenase (short-subunit alcohol dehydrogenase family)
MTQKVLVTAAASGIGLEIARAFSAAGAKVFITDINTQTLGNWIGQTQPRVVKIEGEDLYLQTASPIESGGKKVNSYLKWKRAKKN